MSPTGGMSSGTGNGRHRTPPSLDLTAWFGFFVPKDTPNDIVDLLSRKLRQIIDSPDVQARLIGVGVVPGAMSGAEFERFVTAERKKYGDFLTELAIHTE